MRKSFVRFSLVVASAFVVFGQAAAQSPVNFWYNSFGDAATNMPSVINVTSGTTTRLSVYLKTTGVGSLTGVGVMFGYSTSSGPSGAGSPDDTHATFNAYNWAQGDIGDFQHQAGSGQAVSGSRPYGYYMVGGNINPFAGSGDGVNFHVLDITLNINAPSGTDIPINIWMPPSHTNDTFLSAVTNGAGTEFFPTGSYTGTLHVLGVPEPASMAALGLGALALIRRRRRSR